MEPARTPGIDTRHDLFGHQDHRLAAQLSILPVLACIQQRTELANLTLESQYLVGNVFRRAEYDQPLADRLQRDLIVGLVAMGLEQLDAAILLQLGEQRTIVIDIGSVRIGGIGLRSRGVLGDEYAL